MQNQRGEPESADHSAKNGVVQGHDRGENDVYLTWEELWVTVAAGGGEGNNRFGGWKAIVEGLTGYARPGEVVAVMGPSGCGKTTLLDALAGRLDSNTRQSGDILINGRKHKLAYGTSAYVTQDDILMSTLTVKEAIFYSAQLQLPHKMPLSQKKDRAEATIKEMGLQECMDIRIGGWPANKSLSGGQKRRVNICMEILNRPKLLFLDEPTSGLDSNASYHVMSRIVNLAKQNSMTVIASIHQPSTQVFDLFHNLCLLSLGRTIYFGPSLAANEYFAVNGFPCPALQNPSDHFLRIISTDFEEQQDIEQGISQRLTMNELAINTLASSYKYSDMRQETKRTIANIHIQVRGAMEKRGKKECSFFHHCSVLTRRSFLNMYRDLGYYWLRLAIYIALGVGVGTVFCDVGNTYSSIQARCSMLMFVASFLTMMAIGGFPSFVEDLKVSRRERLNGHYGVGAFVVSNTVSSTPYLFIISLVPGFIPYYLAGLQRGPTHFLYYSLVLFACMMLVESLMMIVATMMPNFLMGLITGAGIQGLMILSGGFFRLPNDLPRVFWRYPMYYIAFHKYAYQGLYKNEFEGLVFPAGQIGGTPSSGEEILRDVWQVELDHSKWVDLAILLAMVVFYRVLFYCVIKLFERVKPLIVKGFRFFTRATQQVVTNPC